MIRGHQAAAVAGVTSGKKGFLVILRECGILLAGTSLNVVVRRCLGDWKPTVSGARLKWPVRHGSPLVPLAVATRCLSASSSRCGTIEERVENSKGSFALSGSKKLYFDTHALVCLLENNGLSTQQSEIIVSSLLKIMNNNMDIIYKDMLIKVQQEIALQQIMSRIGVVKKDMIILEKSEFSALRAENEKIKHELQLLKKQVMDEISKVRTASQLDFNLEKSRVKELYSLNERKLLKMRTEIVELHAQQDCSLTQTERKLDTEVAGLKTMLESHKLDNIKYLAGSVFTCLTVALGFYRLWI